MGGAKSYCPISPLRIPFKILERLTYLHSSRTNHQFITPAGQVGIRHGRSTVYQVTLLPQDIEDGFLPKKACAWFVDLTAAGDTVLHRGFACTLLRLLPDRHMVCMIMELIGNRSFTLTINNNKSSRLRCLKNGVPQGSVFALLLFKHLHLWLANHRLQKVCIRWRFSGDWQAMEGVRSKDMATVGATCSTQLSPVHRVGTHGISIRDTHLCPSHNHSWVFMMTTTTEVRADHWWNAEWLENTMHFHPRHRHPPSLPE